MTISFAGMSDFLNHIIERQDRYDCIIISDSNSHFISDILTHCRLDVLFPATSIYTNPSFYDESGCLRINFHHDNTTCPLTCSINLCKGRVLQGHISKVQAEQDRKYKTIIFIGRLYNQSTNQSKKQPIGTINHSSQAARIHPL